MLMNLIEKGNDNFTLIIGDAVIENITDKDLRYLDKVINQRWYKGDITYYLNDKGIALTEDAFEEVLDYYTDLRTENDGDECGLTWWDCLKEAMSSYPHGNVVTDKMFEKLVRAMVKEPDISILAENLNCNERTFDNLTDKQKEETIIELLKKIKENDNKNIMEIYEDWFC